MRQPESFGRAMRVALDLNATNYDAVDFLRKNYARVLLVHGEGDARTRDVIQQIQSNRWHVPVMIEHGRKTGDPVEEVRKSYQLLRRALLD
jgi:hypothetical protein